MIDFSKPILLQSDNFTPLARTPWAGPKIMQNYKSELGLSHGQERIGESWEFSCDPAFPSRLAVENIDLLACFQQHAVPILGADWPTKMQQPSSQILLKLLDAGDNLSLQVHPADGDAYLAANECGKPESWYILEADPGAGIYLGFSKSLPPAELKNMLLQGRFNSEALQFVPVQAGDYFEIAPGVPHAIGAGVTLLEPQRILPGLSGKTYRLWDWNRLYDQSGELSAKGQPRDLHIRESLSLIDSEKQVGLEFVAKLRRRPAIDNLSPTLILARFPANDHYRLSILASTANDESYELPAAASYRIALVLSGRISLSDLELKAGQCVLIPQAANRLNCRLGADAKLALIDPQFP